MGNKSEIGRRIRLYRKSRNLTQARLAEMIGKSVGAIGMYEKGKREPDMDTIEALADAFNIRMRDLIPDDDTPITEDAFDAVRNEFGVYYHTATPAFRIISSGLSELPQEEQEKILAVLRAMYSSNPDLFSAKRGNDDET